MNTNTLRPMNGAQPDLQRSLYPSAGEASAIQTMPLRGSELVIAQKVELLRWMQRSRECDRRESLLFRQSKGWLQMPCAGHEFTAALANAIKPGDYVYPHYRDRALMIALGVSVHDIALAYFAKAESSSAGRQLPNHFSNAGLRIMSVASPTALQCLPAAGSAWACQMEGNGGMVLCCVGDASARQGEFYEALSLAIQESLPIVFVMEDNRYGISTPTARMNPFLIGSLPLDRVRRLSGTDLDSIQGEMAIAARRATEGHGPSVLWIETERLMSHTASDDQRIYRSEAELALSSRKDPVAAWRSRLIAEGIVNEEHWRLETVKIASEVERDYDRAFQSADPESSLVMAEIVGHQRCTSFAGLPSSENWTMVSALNAKLGELLEKDAKVILFGEDIEDPKGGVFGLTRGLSSRFPGRVKNSPLAEATIVGTAVGLAVAGFRPIFELQFIDFAGTAFNQIANQLATLRWRTNGEWRCPVTILAPSGAYLPGGGPWHSQSNESQFAHIPGLRVVEPSTPHAAAALLDLAAKSEDPVLMLLPKHLFRVRQRYEPDEEFAFGRGVIRRRGADLTIAAWGNCIPLALEAAEELERCKIDAEVVDLYSLAPCDWDLLGRSVRKTGRLMVVSEDNRTGGFGQAVIAEMVATKPVYEALSAAPALIARPDVHVPHHPVLERSILPQISDIVKGAKDLCCRRISKSAAATVFRRASPEDAAALAELFQAAYAHSSHPCKRLEVVTAALEGGDIWHVATRGNRLAACQGIVRHQWNQSWESVRGVTHPDFQGEGLATRLAQRCFDDASDSSFGDILFGYPRNRSMYRILSEQVTPRMISTGHDGAINIANGVREYHLLSIAAKPGFRFQHLIPAGESLASSPFVKGNVFAPLKLTPERGDYPSDMICGDLRGARDWGELKFNYDEGCPSQSLEVAGYSGKLRTQGDLADAIDAALANFDQVKHIRMAVLVDKTSFIKALLKRGFQITAYLPAWYCSIGIRYDCLLLVRSNFDKEPAHNGLQSCLDRFAEGLRG